MRRRGFTLIELLVVIGIIAVLLAILMPSLSKLRHEASMTRCMSDEQQYVHAVMLYANDHKGILPRFDRTTGAGNPHDVPIEFYKALLHYGMKHESFFCPFTDQQTVDLPITPATPWVQTGYAWWGQRKTGGTLMPPDPPSANVVGASPVRGPSYIGDPIGLQNPIVTDDIYLFPAAVSNPSTFNVSTAPAQDFYQQTGDSSHMWHGMLNAINIAFIDGHVERVPPPQVHCVYKSLNAWVCR